MANDIAGLYTCRHVSVKMWSTASFFCINYNIIVYFLFDFSFIFAKFADNYALETLVALFECL